jgi:alpha/beta superfamily hydrolase
MQSTLETGQVIVVERVAIDGGPYRLEGELAYPETAPPVGAAVIAGPHPLLGGNRQNNVVRGVGDGLAARGLATLRFDYRGVGGSDGPAVDVAEHMARFWATGHVPDEMALAEDVRCAVGHLRRAAGPHLPLALVGYSFGCALLPFAPLDGTNRPVLVLVAPTVGKHDYDSYKSVSSPVLVLASEDDFAADAARLERWVDGLTAPARLIVRLLDNHFFRGHEPWLAETIADFLADQWR